MPRPGVSYDDVAESIHTLEKAGLQPSIRLIREKLGKGSLTTIAEHKRAFETDRAEGPTEALPDPIAKGLIQGAQTYWQELVDAAEGEIEAIRTEAADSQSDLEKRIDEAQAQITKLQDGLGAKEAEIHTLTRTGEKLTAAVEERDQTLQALEVDAGRVSAKYDALKAQHAELQAESKGLREVLTKSESERVRLAERLEQQATEYAKDKTTLQKHFNEYKDRLVTMSDDVHQANTARREAEKVAAESDKRAATSERECKHLNKDLIDLKDENHSLIEAIGELRGQLASADARLTDERRACKQLLKEKQQRTADLETAVSEAQALVRQYVSADRRLAQELIDERKAEPKKTVRKKKSAT